VRQPMCVVAVFAANPALTAVLSATLAAMPGLRVRGFDSRAALETYMRLAPVDLLVCDFDCEDAPAGELTRALRRNAALNCSAMQVIALTRRVGPHLKVVATMHGIDEVIAKPMSPKYLLERVTARLRCAPREMDSAAPHEVLGRRPSRQASVGRGWNDNVVPLFPHGPSAAR
jgi:two-component system, OmpR family, phosphate regulon response regulator PhoB